jgi:hypothetical protein
MASCAPAFPADLRAFVDAETWTFAKTMPDWPHEYIVRDRVDGKLFRRLVLHVRAHGYEGRFYARPITYFEEAGRVYWTMGAPLDETIIVNRCRGADTYESRLANGTLPEQLRAAAPERGEDAGTAAGREQGHGQGQTGAGEEGP